MDLLQLQSRRVHCDSSSIIIANAMIYQCHKYAARSTKFVAFATTMISTHGKEGRIMQLESFFPYRLAVAAEAFSRQLIEVYGRTYGLKREEWRLIFLLARAQRIDSLELGRRTTLDKVQVSRAAARLEEKGLITKTTPDNDRRLRVYGITAEGQALFNEILPQVEARASEILKSMSAEDRAALDQGLEALKRAVEGRRRSRGKG
ncbi:MarR family winged helix-turn-helix transcriptional regulator [Frigidibacter sp. RF13]|uniref:MarR family winged helix-turn-helix transcriptional regulator n=1 Tax=Frigidibacter sp. RF13 TaxID=2997340 RepID=UPI00226FF992|nr:MarR family transcriptional regulator [Frigidibacter sp. RF13]